MQNSTHTIKYLLDYVRQSLADLYPAREAQAICHLLFENILGVAPATLYILLENAVDAAHEQRIRDAAAQLRQGRPIQQVLGRAEFCGLTFLVNEHVLIPRPETEELVEWALRSADARAALRVLDVGTGSGCIAVALAGKLPRAAVDAWDVSEDALSVARKNAALNGVQVHFEKRDILCEATKSGAQRYDLVVSNPPYVCESEKRQMHRNVLRYEPHVALFVDDKNPLIFYSAIAELAQKALRENGEAFVEVNEKLGQEVADVFTRHGFLSVELRRDVNGKPRMIRAKR
ncbi:MAG: peptide chain release factor N(5)-glutamine methyltransferase [Prevotellaceae bacterium]|jgi:release factor glutamine methyltransferase|nr:peptide chain release factor N(5)-glutamine methyltransferase [Prevotellaceae bacterium]